ncbi:hypothetical protein AVEN_93855-1 [Araneus ventricosus]|uniref:Uncharacterized protein n=1 Tax=Araneus ventricosus TaxID=182803 RepID=A0A4Y2B0L5_ARAVE|nr:hypothetical protein AVEN_93855-1 [Araneus ventricosus]
MSPIYFVKDYYLWSICDNAKFAGSTIKISNKIQPVAKDVRFLSEEELLPAGGIAFPLCRLVSKLRRVEQCQDKDRIKIYVWINISDAFIMHEGCSSDD